MNLKGDLKLDEIVKVPFPAEQYYPIDHKKSQIVLHHSAGFDNALGVFQGWKSDSPRVATCAAIDSHGKVYEIYDPKFWAYHVNIMSKGNNAVREDEKFKKYFTNDNAVSIENRTIGVEVCNWGSLTYIDGKFHTWASKPVIKKAEYTKDITIDDKHVIHYPEKFRGYEFFERYSDASIESLWRLIRSWCATYDIPTRLVGNIFVINEDALKGTRGIFSHVSYRIDKQDLHPQPEILEMLAAL